MWDLPGPGLEPMSPALAGGFLTTAPPGRSCSLWFFVSLFLLSCLLLDLFEHYYYSILIYRVFNCFLFYSLLVVPLEITVFVLLSQSTWNQHFTTLSRM